MVVCCRQAHRDPCVVSVDVERVRQSAYVVPAITRKDACCHQSIYDHFLCCRYVIRINPAILAVPVECQPHRIFGDRFVSVLCRCDHKVGVCSLELRILRPVPLRCHDDSVHVRELAGYGDCGGHALTCRHLPPSVRSIFRSSEWLLRCASMISVVAPVLFGSSMSICQV